VAILSESQTAFGSRDFVLDSAKSATSVAARSERQCWYDNPDAANTSLRDCVLRLSFPREIYRLRSAYPDAPRLAAGSVRADNPPASGLTLNLKIFAGREDDLPSFSREQLPLSQEAVMLSLAETIHRRKIKMVGVEASDVFDSLFVMRFLQEFSPDVRLFILDSDLLFIRAADNLSLQGTLAITDYPLSSSIQSWQSGKRVLRSFANRNAEVTYNAFLALIGKTQGMRDYSWTRPEQTKCAAPGEPATSEPMLWLTVVSRNGFQPVHLLDCKANEESPVPFIMSSSAPPEFHPDRPSGGYLLLCGLLLVVTLAQLALAAVATRSKVTLLDWVLEYFHIARNSKVRTQKAYLLANSFIVLAVLEHVEEHRAAPVPGRVAFGGRAVFEHIALVAGTVAPAEAAALIDRVQGVDDDWSYNPPKLLSRPSTLMFPSRMVVLGKSTECLPDRGAALVDLLATV